jgi:hypothetical protein
MGSLDLEDLATFLMSPEKTRIFGRANFTI